MQWTAKVTKGTIARKITTHHHMPPTTSSIRHVFEWYRIAAESTTESHKHTYGHEISLQPIGVIDIAIVLPHVSSNQPQRTFLSCLQCLCSAINSVILPHTSS